MNDEPINHKRLCAIELLRLEVSCIPLGKHYPYYHLSSEGKRVIDLIARLVQAIQLDNYDNVPELDEWHTNDISGW